MKDKARIGFHSIALIHHLYVCKYCEDVDFTGATEPEVIQLQDHGHRYFTTWNLVMQTLYLTLALMHDIYRKYPKYANKKVENKLDLWKGYLFTALVFPCTVFVCCMFWSVYSINREWVLPKVIDSYLPSWVNQSLHTNVLIFIAIELLLTRQKFFIPSFKSAFYGISFLSIIYQCMFFYTYFESGKWLYGLFKVLNWPERILFSFFNYISLVVALKAGIILQIWIHEEASLNKL